MARFNPAALLALTLSALDYGSSAASAQEIRIGPATYAVTVHHPDLHPRSERDARAMLNRLTNATMAACGASSFSLREVRASVQESTCWRDGMAEVLARIGDPTLSAAYSDQHLRHRVAREDRP